jgi:methylase of polypeptide subunit release factors
MNAVPDGSSQRPQFDIHAAKAFIEEANRVRDSHPNETVTRHTLVGGLADTFPSATRPWWVHRHIRGAEAHVGFAEVGEERRGFVDSVVGLTAIEYEKDLRSDALFRIGKHQVRQYCAGLLNEGADPTRIRGVLSDGVEWYAYGLRGVGAKPPGTYDVASIELIELETLSCATADDRHADLWVDFLVRHLGREGTRPLTAPSVADYLGFDSGFGAAHLLDFDRVVLGAMADDPDAADLVQRIWTSFVSYLSVEPTAATFDTTTYVQEFYLAILARLLCANVVMRRALRSDDAELGRILDGRFFEAKGLHRLVEHDYFGWLTSPAHLDTVRPLATSLQGDLAAYDFDASPDEDVFGAMIAMLAQRTRRLLLGQEGTPAWLATRLAERMFEALPEGDAPHFVDMCCGSGSMMVAVTRLARARLSDAGIDPGSREALDYLVQAATGFDIDPLAVILAKVNWVVTNRDWLEPFDGSNPVSLPVYHADSLFALAPVFDGPAGDGHPTADYTLRLLDKTVDLPRFLVAPATQAVFDALLERTYSLAMDLAATPGGVLDQTAVETLVDEVLAETGVEFEGGQRASTIEFGVNLVATLAQLKRDRKNDIWVFVIRNSYRPGLVAGQFNGIISNPPWLALSKLGLNPFSEVLKTRAEQYGLTAPGSAFPHLEMATTFLAHAVENYLAEDGLVGCILPDTVRNGAQHRPFRVQVGRYDGTTPRFRMALDSLWKVDAGVFKNRAVVAIAHKADPSQFEQVSGKLVRPGSSDEITHYVASFGDRMVWSPNPPGDGVPGGYPPGFASQGADIMPRRLIMVSEQPRRGGRSTVSTPAQDGPDWYLLSDAKKHMGFSITPRTLPKRFVQRCLISKHVAPFVIAPSAAVVLPIERTRGHSWRFSTPAEIASSPTARDHFENIVDESDFASLKGWIDALDYRSKLTKQALDPDSWLVVYGAGGGIPAAAYAQVRTFGDVPPVIDQTLYWILTEDEDEAVFLTGLINSESLLERIADFIPEGDFGDRHLHTLPSKAVPQYDAADDTHARVVSAARPLIIELNEHRHVAGEGELFTIEVPMVSRRSRLRALVKSLESYDEYAAACAGLYETVALH